MPIFEIRIPTYKRPHFLRRALRSLQEQTESDWAAFVFDDSQAGEGEPVVKELKDERIVYHRNSRNLGAADNIDQAFRKQPLTDARFFKILSDDNFLFSGFLRRGRELIETTECKIILINEQVVDFEGKPHNAAATTRGEWFSPGVIPIRTLYSSLFLFEGISDGGLFWARDSQSDFEVGRGMSEVCLQEACRTLKIVEPVFFEPAPLAAFSLLPPDQVVRQTGGGRLVSRGRAEIMRYLLRRGGAAITSGAIDFARRVGKLNELRRNWESALRWEKAPPNWSPNLYWRLRGIVRDAHISNPVATFLASEPGVFPT